MYEYKIVDVRGHYEVYCGNAFLCSADTIAEAMAEIAEADRELEGKNERK